MQHEYIYIYIGEALCVCVNLNELRAHARARSETGDQCTNNAAQSCTRGARTRTHASTLQSRANTHIAYTHAVLIRWPVPVAVARIRIRISSRRIQRNRVSVFIPTQSVCVCACVLCTRRFFPAFYTHTRIFPPSRRRCATLPHRQPTRPGRIVV